MNGMSPMQLIKILKNSSNPSQAMIGIMEERAGENPLYANLIDMAKKGDSQQIEVIARNIFKEKGLDFDKEFNSFKKKMGL